MVGGHSGPCVQDFGYRNGGEVIYVLRQNGAYKIGFTSNLKQRYPRRVRERIVLTIESNRGPFSDATLEENLQDQFRHLQAGTFQLFNLGEPELSYLLTLPGAKLYVEK